eukprot:TRINITY_DN28808_c0_g1_i1.p1 TRINITY_DN28808_c0_g1~~TRINITY_DN28808_c0_g1_i1.p1  ORF type:complete len:182 (+),score=24.84 TRINITY_DN28808_c0_g1_i1:38-583(+)
MEPPADKLDSAFDPPDVFHKEKRIYTEVFLQRPDGSVLLGEKKRGFKKGKFFGYGGKVEPSDKSIEGAAFREMVEESGIDLKASGVPLKEIGKLYVQFNFPKKYLEIHAFKVNIKEESVLSNLRETDEMKPMWFMPDAIPWEKCLPDVRSWYPLVINESHFSAQFVLGENDTCLFEEIVNL